MYFLRKMTCIRQKVLDHGIFEGIAEEIQRLEEEAKEQKTNEVHY